MKFSQKLITHLVALVLSTMMLQATLRIVDGTGGGGKFAKLSEAISAANAGDTIFIQPGVYDETQTVSVDKRLIIFGNGYKDSLTTTFVTYAIEVADAADGTIFQSMKFMGAGTVLKYASGADNGIVSDCMFVNNNLWFDTSQKDTIRNNIFLTENASYSLVYISGTSSNIVVCNNVFDGTTTTTTYGVNTSGTMSNIRIFNNFFSELTYPIYTAQNNNGYVIVSNIFFKTTNISTSASDASVYSSNWLYSVPNGAVVPANGEANGTGNAQFVRFDEVNGFIFTGNTTTDSDLRIKSSAAIYPASPIDGGYLPVAPMGSGYVDVLQQPGAINTNRSDAGIFGGPQPFASIYAPATIPSASAISITPNPVGPKGKITVNVSGGFGGDGGGRPASAVVQSKVNKAK